MTDQTAADVQFGRQFVFVRNGAVIADGTEFPDGHVAIHWTGTTYPTLTPHQTMDAAIAAHNEDGALRVVWQLAGIPQAEYGSVWPELVGWVTAAHEDGDQIDPAQLLEYMRELKQRALAPVEQWMDSVRSTAPQADGQHRPPCVDGDHCGEAAHCPPIVSATEAPDAARQTGQHQAAEAFRPVEVDGTPVLVRCAGSWTAEDQEHMAEIVRAAKRRYEAEHPGAGRQDSQPTATEQARVEENEARYALMHLIGDYDDETTELLDAYRAAILNSAADEIAAVDFHPNAKAQCLELAQGFARRLRRLAAGAES